MKTRYKFIHFKKFGIRGEWACLNNKTKDVMGVVGFYKFWKQYTIDFHEQCVFNNQCLRDIADFLDQLNKERKQDEKV